MGGWNSPVFILEPSRNCHSTATLERHHGDLVTLRLVQLNPKPNSQPLNRIQSHVVMDHAHTSAVLVLHKGSRVSVELPMPSPAGMAQKPTDGWLETGLAQETQDFVEAADVQVLYRCVQEKMTLKRRWSPFWMILAGKICFKSGVKEVPGAASAMFMWCWNYTSAQSKTQPKSEFHNYAANPSFSIIATPSKRFLLATSHTSSNKT